MKRVFNKTSYTSSSSGSVSSYQVISFYFKVALVSINPTTVAFVSLAIYDISSILGRRLFIFK